MGLGLTSGIYLESTVEHITLHFPTWAWNNAVTLSSPHNQTHHRTERGIKYSAMMDDGSTELKSVVFNRSPLELHRGGNCDRRETVGAKWAATPMNISKPPQDQTPDSNWERGREKERAREGQERCKREWVDGGKAWLMLPQTLGAGFARSARPEKQKRCHYREERSSAEERTEGGERECQKGRLTLSSFFYTRTQFLQPAESARAAVGPQV